MRIIKYLYIVFVVWIVIFSYFFVDANFPLPSDSFIRMLSAVSNTVKTLLYSGTIILGFLFYLYFLLQIVKKSNKMNVVWFLIKINSLLLISYPAFSFDIFNYIATSKVLFFYRENPYIVMPIEFSNEPLLMFMHAANKTALYGPVWILLTSIPHLLGFGNLFLTIFTFKVFIYFFYIGICSLIWIMTKRNTFKLLFFALNPLVVYETIVSGHNDVVMMFFALLSFYLIRKRMYIFSITCFICSILIKYATLFLLPIFIWTLVQSIRKRKIEWQIIWKFSFFSLFVIFLFSPLREEMYSWYLIWPLLFLSLCDGYTFIKTIVISLSLGLLFRFVPFVYYRSWGGNTPIIKMIATGLPILVSSVLHPFTKKHFK